MVASDAPRNQVIEASPAAGQRLEPGDTVQLVVSRGPAGAAENAGNNANANGTGTNGNGNGNGKGKGKGRGN
jgi:serine/threonine-protein kinase